MIDLSFIAGLEEEACGLLSFAYQGFPDGPRLGHRAHEPVPTASVIKVPILVHVALLVEEGHLRWEEELTVEDAEKTPGTGILRGLTGGIRLSVRDLCYLMIVLSDNTATNVLIERLGIVGINRRIHDLGFRRTRLLRKAYGVDVPGHEAYGFGMTTPGEIAELLARLAAHTVGTPQCSETILAMLAEQQDRAAIPRCLPDRWHYAGKSGSISSMRADVGIVTAPDGRQFILACFCHGMEPASDNVDHPGLLAIARLARRLL